MPIYRHGRYGNKFRACHVQCAKGFKSDRAHGLTYAPEKKPGGEFYLNREEASLDGGWCAYCGADVRTSRKRSVEVLRREAAKTAKSRGHKLRWERYFRNGRLVAEGKCGCGASVQCLTHPLPNEVDIGGDAVALNCLRNPSC